MLKLFARLKEISAKLPGTSRSEGEDLPTDAPAPRPIELPPIAPVQRPHSNKWDRSAASTTPTKLGSPQPPQAKPNTVRPVEKIDELEPESEPISVKTVPPKPGNTTKAKTQISGAVGTTIGRIGSVMARPFRGSKSWHKKPSLWAGSGLALTALLVGGAWLFVDRSVSEYKAEDALNYVRPGTISIEGVDGTMLLQTGNGTRETLKSWQMPTRLKQAFVAIEDSRFYQHDGVDYKGVARAMVSNLTSKSLVEG
ncbi:MAG: hypothetical protein RLZZ135_3, partial [Cyanobacteriota bacterium]